MSAGAEPSTREAEAGRIRNPRQRWGDPASHLGSGHRDLTMPPWPVSRLGVQGESRPCVQPSPGAPGCSIADIQLFSMAPYVLNLTAVHPAGARSTLVPFVPERISESPPLPSPRAPTRGRP